MNNQLDFKPFVFALLKESFRSGSIAAIAMMPVGLIFFLFGFRINEYGMRVIQSLFNQLPTGQRFLLFIIEHFVISWAASLPLLFVLLLTRTRLSALAAGIMYGLGFYVAINSFMLPWVFGDKTPWQIGLHVIYPSLLVHLVYGASISLTSWGFVSIHRNLGR